MGFKFNNIDSPSYLIVNDIRFPIMPNISQHTLKVNGRPGLVDFGNEFGERVIEIDVTIIAENHSKFRQYCRELANWLYEADACPLVHPEDTSKYVMAKITDNTVFTEILSTGKGTLQFICTDPYIYSSTGYTLYTFPVSGAGLTVTNTGSAYTFPIFDIVFTADTTFFTLTTDLANEYLWFGSTVNVDTETEYEVEPIDFNDTMSSTGTPWTQAGAVENGTNTGTMTSNGTQWTASGYGTGTGWHGPALTRATTQALTDFSITADVGFLTQLSYDELGKIDIYGKDASGNVLCKMTIYDSSAEYDLPKVAARIGTLTGYKNMCDTVGDYPGRLRNWYKGKLRIKRIGKQWTFWFAKYYPDSNEIAYAETHYMYDTAGVAVNALASVQVHIASYGENDPVAVMNVQNLTVFNENPTPPTANSIPIAFKAGDVLHVDCEKGIILKNSEPFYSLLDVTSKFIRIPYYTTANEGEFTITASPSNVINPTASTVKFVERWL